MKMSRRALRMERHHKRHKRQAGLNMISLMDIFTILVFFLLVNSSDVEALPPAKALKLPESVAEQKPKQTLVIMVNDRSILVQGRVVARVAEVNASTALIISPLREELGHQAARARALQTARTPFRGEVTVMGDKEIPFELLKKIMVTCARSDYGRISLAVLRKGGGQG